MNSMGMFATLKGDKYERCPKCNQKAEWQSKALWLKYQGRDIWIGYEHNIELDENMNGDITAYCWKFLGCTGCGKITKYSIINGILNEITEDE